MRALALLLILLLTACGTSGNNNNGPADTGWEFIAPDNGVTTDDVPEVPDDVIEPDDVPVPEPDVPVDVEPPSDEGTPPADPGPPPTDVGPPDIELPEPNGVPKFSNCSDPGGDRNIYDIQDPQCPDHITPEPTEAPGVDIALKGVIVTGVFSDTLFVQEANGGPYSGMAIFLHGMVLEEVVRGTVLNLDGGYTEYFDNTQLFLQNWEIVKQGDAPEPFQVSHPAHVATGGEMAEMMEGVLISVEDLATIHTKPDCPQDWGEFLVTGELRVDDLGILWDARLGDHFDRITGPLYYGFGNYKIEPRDDKDIEWTEKGASGSTSKCIETDCQVPASIQGTHEVVISEIMADPFGPDSGQEWIELYNTTNKDIDINGWELRDCGTQKLPLLGSSLVIPAKGYLVVGSNANQTTNGGVPIDLGYGNGFYLPNSVGSVILFNGNDVFAEVVDNTRYSAFEPWDAFVTGRTLERTGKDSDGTDPNGWKSGKSKFGVADNQGTPGAKNDAWQ